ncbi:hypothetical protein CHF27_011285 [Romboutsia maritimum]|uniref:Uncharacterized protein n=1 Tax=Romboutsia maritimum TaxID=2020948 RepID=A0A371IQX9_9FIRM|nr:hypothetical protein [Romboutsia maritimum]RDY22895.1 hypothetical protein CHF27_011285 [Romboutsia maritimum]
MKKVIGIMSIVLFLIVSFQSMIAGLGNAISANGEASGSAGIMLAICMLIAGILTLVSKNSKGILITAIVFYVIGGITGLANVGSYADLQIWSILNLIFAALLIFSIVKNKKVKAETK